MNIPVLHLLISFLNIPSLVQYQHIIYHFIGAVSSILPIQIEWLSENIADFVKKATELL